MANFGMNGPYDFDADTISEKVAEKKIGNYALGHMKQNVFIVEYVGRSDTDVQERLLGHI